MSFILDDFPADFVGRDDISPVALEDPGHF
jgi:hypothetical protein